MKQRGKKKEPHPVRCIVQHWKRFRLVVLIALKLTKFDEGRIDPHRGGVGKFVTTKTEPFRGGLDDVATIHRAATKSA